MGNERTLVWIERGAGLGSLVVKISVVSVGANGCAWRKLVSPTAKYNGAPVGDFAATVPFELTGVGCSRLTDPFGASRRVAGAERFSGASAVGSESVWLRAPGLGALRFPLAPEGLMTVLAKCAVSLRSGTSVFESGTSNNGAPLSFEISTCSGEIGAVVGTNEEG